jgi:hypothetical protein
VRDDKNQINNLELVHATSEDELNVILFKLPKVVEGLDEFMEVGLVVNKEGKWSGRLIIKGQTIGENGSKAFEGDTPQEGQPTFNGVPGGDMEAEGGLKPGNVKIKPLENGDLEVTTIDQNGKPVKTKISCGHGGCPVNTPVNIPGVGTIHIPELPANGTPVTIPAPGNGGHHQTTTTTEGGHQTTTTEGGHQTTTTRPAPTTTRPSSPTTTRPTTTTAAVCPPGEEPIGPNGGCKVPPVSVTTQPPLPPAGF